MAVAGRGAARTPIMFDDAQLHAISKPIQPLLVASMEIFKNRSRLKDGSSLNVNASGE